MKRFAFPVILIVAGFLFLLGAMTEEDIIEVRIDSFGAWSNGAQYSSGFLIPTEVMNFDYKVRGDNLYLSQRRGYENHLAGVVQSSPAFMDLAWTVDNTGATLAQHIVIVGRDGTIYSTRGGVGYSALTDGAGAIFVSKPYYCTAITMKDTLVIASQDSIINVVGTLGNGTLEISKRWAWDYPILTLHQDRIYASGGRINRDGNVGEASKVIYRPEFCITGDSAATKTNSGFFYVGNEDDGSFVTALLSLGHYLIVYKNNSIHRVTISAEDNTPYEAVEVNDHLGTFYQTSVCGVDNTHYFVNTNGVYSFDGQVVTKLSQPIDDFFRDSTAYKSDPQLGFYRSGIAVMDNRLYVSVPVDTSVVTGSRVLVFDLQLGVWTKYSIAASRFLRVMLPQQNCIPGGALPTQGGPYSVGTNITVPVIFFTRAADIDSFIYVYPWSNKDNGTNIASEYSVRATDLGDSWNRKQMRRVSAILQGTGSVQFGWYADSSISNAFATTLTSTATPVVRHQAVNSKIEGSLIGFRMLTSGADSLQVYALEFGVRRTGAGLQD